MVAPQATSAAAAAANVTAPNSAGTPVLGKSSPGGSTPNGSTKGKLGPQTAPGTLNGPPSGNNHAIPLSARRAGALDMSTVERRGRLKRDDERPKTNRLFGIPEAPTYFPSADEFRDPMEYIRKIAPEGSRYGIVKIVPPDNWNPPFAINTERFHFRTRRQELNSVEGGNRVNNDYLDQLAKFHKQNGHNLNRFPSVDKRPLDLYRLKKTVERKGGFEQVCKGKRWAEVGRDLGYSGKIMSSLSTSLKNSYQKWLLPYEDYLRVAKPGVQQQIEMMNGGPYTPSPGTSPIKKTHTNTPNGGSEESPAMRASAALNASINGHSPSQPLRQQELANEKMRPVTTGFTAVNSGGFTAVNAQPRSFTPVNGSFSDPSSNIATPQSSFDPSSIPNGHTPIAPQPNGTSTLKRQHSDSILTPEEVDAISRRSKRLRKDVPTVAGSNMHHSRMSAARFQSRDRSNFRSGEMCENCGKAEDSKRFILCQSCEAAYHMYCLEPPLKQKPDHEWHCTRCLVGTNEYGFEDGDVYSLSAFQKKADEFKRIHFANIPRQFNPLSESKKSLDENDVEREFWRLVEDISDTTEVEYGADIHSTTHGSGFPTIEKQPRNQYSSDPWNLNLLPLDKDSLFRHIKSDISGMTVPWLYVGMVFSTFCWHNEDHYAYSANYQHFGETKTWYGIPAEDSERFEQAMREEVPELFETHPDLLFQLVTLARPEKLRKAGVRVYAIDQRAGQFVITFPRAYHAGFNHGFNFNEAVNFAPHDWEPFGDEGVKRLRYYRKQACFSHDELLLTAASRDHSIRTSKWLAPAMERMRDEELAARKHFLQAQDSDSEMAVEDPYTGPRYEAPPDPIDSDSEEEEIICTYCKHYCYLSRFQCKKTGKYLCALHAGSYECCDALEHERYSGHDGTHRLYFRLADDALKALVQKVVDKANIPENWTARVDNELDENARPSLKHLRTLLTEGEKIQYELPQLPDLRRFVERCNEWVEEATNYITRKQQNRRKSEKPWRRGTKAAEMEERDKELRNVDNIRRLLATADEISFDCSEIHTLRERAENIAEFQSDANEALNSIRSMTTVDFEELVERGKDFHVDIPEIDSLEKVVKRLKWDDRAKLMHPDPETQRQDRTLKEIELFIEEGVEMGVPETNPDIQFFREHKATGEHWERKAKELMAAEQVHYQQLDSLSVQAAKLAINPDTLAAVDAILKKQREIQDKIQSLYERSKSVELRFRPSYKEVKDVMESLEELQSKPAGTIDLEKEIKRHEDWMRRGKKLFGKANAPLHILHQHMSAVAARNEACFEVADKPRMPVEPSSRQQTPDETQAISDGSNSSRDVFCICRRSEAGMMIECEYCHEWYHGKCLKIARGKVKEEDKYTCPICDWRVKIPRDAARPKLEDLQGWQDELDTLPFQPDEEQVLFKLIDDGQTYRDFIKPIIHSDVPATMEEVGVMRFHLRKIEGADILLAEETNFLRRELHRWAPVAPDSPPIIQVSHSTRKPRPTKQQKLMAQLGITNPEDLPQQYKIKPGFSRRKNSEPDSAPEATQPPQSASDVQSLDETPGVSRPKPFLTALAVQNLGPLAGAPVVSQILQSEPHANRDKLLKMRLVLENNPHVRDDLQAFISLMNSTPTPRSHTPGFSFDGTQNNRASTSSSYRDSSLFPNSPTVHSNPNEIPRLGSPAHFTSTQNGQTSPHHSYDPQLFQSTHESMFDSPANENKSSLVSPDFGGRSGFFDSPKTGAMGHSGFHSPGGFGGSQHSAGNMDAVFADLVNDHDGLTGLESASDHKDVRAGGVDIKPIISTTERPDIEESKH